MRSFEMLAVVGATLVLGAAATFAAADPVAKCQRTIAKEASKFAQAKSKALANCEIAKVKGKLPALTDCHTESKTAAAIATTTSKLGAAIGKQCGGADKVCGGDLTGESGGSAIGFGPTCPDFENSSCTNAIGGVDCTGIAECLTCLNEAAVDQAIDLYFGDLQPTDPAVEKDLNKCQQEIGKVTQKFLAAKSKALQKCWDGRLKAKHGNNCPSPGDGKAAAAIAKAESQKIAAICKKCGGDDNGCDQTVTGPNGTTIPGTGGSDDFTPAEIGFQANCPSVTIPGGPSCAGAVSTLADLVECVDCVTEFKVDCLDAAQVPEFVSYPSECNPAGGPTPTPGGPTATPTLGPLPTGTPTSTQTPSATATRTLTPAPSQTPSATPTPVEIRMQSDLTFSPADVTVPAGRTVRWVNEGPMRHNTTSDTGLWSSRTQYPSDMRTGEVFSHTIPPETPPGSSLFYTCTLHGEPGDGTRLGIGMVGVIRVP